MHHDDDVRVSVWLEPEIIDHLDDVARLTGHSREFHICEAIERGLFELEYEYSLLSKAELFKNGRLETRSLAEVEADLDLDD